MKTKTFDCVRMKRKGAERVLKQLEGKSLQEQLEYWQKGTEDLKRLQRKLKKTGGRSSSPRRPTSG
jgi:exonuclease VII small subunit